MTKITALTDLEIPEVTVCRKGANGRRVAFRKSEAGEMPKTKQEIIKSILETEADNEAKVVEIVKETKVSESAAEAIVCAHRALAAYSDEIPASTHGLIAKALGLQIDAKEAPKPDPIATLSPEAKEAFAKQASIAKAAEAKAAAAEAEAVEIRKSIEEIKTNERRKEFVAKAATYKAVAGDVAKTGELMRKVSEMDPEMAKHLESILSAAQERVAKSELFATKGDGRAEVSTGWDAIKSAASELRKSMPGLSEAQAVRKVVTENPSLKRAYREQE